MAILTVNNIPFDYPDPGSDPGWGEQATDWAAEVTSVLSSLLAPGDIVETTSTILNNQSSALDISGMAFSNSVVRAANVDYTVIRTTATPTTLVESGTLFFTYDTVNGTWYMSQTKAEDADIVFSITSLGQVQYTSSNMSGGSYSGQITFKARTLSQ